MISKVHRSFWKQFDRLPADVQHRARAAYQRFRDNPSHPGLEFKEVKQGPSLWSVRISRGYRAVGTPNSKGEMIWFFIGTHADYDHLLDET